ncbi:WH2 motif protein [Trichuris trichiura]|uniref:WH2 motif protein n=1 Tax=Trichuris trichiura TaxID=36087 RepID=A0A077Z1M6_TRITR|nr:WH2 motif protein [Trichuris trichiura]
MADNSRLLEQIRDGVKLRSVKTVDKSKPLILAENESLKNLIGTPASCRQSPITFGNQKNGNSPGADRAALMNEIRAGIKLRHIDAPLVSTQARTNSLGSSKALTPSKQQEEKKVTSNTTVINAAHAAIVRQMVAELKTTNTFHSPLHEENDQNVVRDVPLERLSTKQATSTFSVSPDSFPLANSVSEQQKSKDKVTISACPNKSPAKMRSEMQIQLRCSRSKQPVDSLVGKTVKVNKKPPPVNLVSAKSFMAVTLKEPLKKNSPWSFQTVRVSPRGGRYPETKSSALSVHHNGRTTESSSQLLDEFAESRLLNNGTQRSDGFQSILSAKQNDQGKHGK